MAARAPALHHAGVTDCEDTRRLRGRFHTSLVALALIMALGAPAAMAQEPRPLIELAAPAGNGWLYTISEEEAAKAVAAPYFYVRQPQPAAIIWAKGFEGSRPLFRCRYTQRPSYLVTPLPGECDRDDLRLEGVLGSIATAPAPGLAELHRYTLRGEWRVAFGERGAQLLDQGYTHDGRLGWAIDPAATPPSPPPPVPPAPEPPIVDPCERAAGTAALRIAAGRSRALARSRTVRPRRRAGVRVRGVLRGADGAPLANAAVCVLSARLTRGARPRRLGLVTTNDAGRFSFRVRRGPSRRVVFVHRSAGAAASATLVLRVRRGR
jgi:hypothetical protein